MTKNNAIDIDIETGGGNTYTFPSATSTLATLDLAETLTSKDLSAASNTLGSANVAAAGALMDSELTSIADVKALDQSVVSGAAPVFDGTNFTNIPAGTVDVVSNVATARILGRTTAGSGDSEELTASATRTFLNVEDGATANSTNATLLARANHTGTQLAATISNFAATVRATILTGLSTATSTAVVAADTILVAIGKLQAQVTLKVTGPASATDNAIARFDSTTGKLLQSSSLFVTDAGAINTGSQQSWNIVRPDGTITVSFLDNGYTSPTASNGVNYFQFSNSSTGGDIQAVAGGSDTNISINLFPKGTGELQVGGEKIIDETDTASTTVAGIVELATDAETTAGTATNRAITPANAKVELDKKANIRGAVNAQAGTTYTLVIGDEYLDGVRMTNASANTLTIPPNADVALPVGTKVFITQGGAGSTTIAAGAGVTINAPSTVTLAIDEQWESRVCQKTGTNEWLLI